MDSKKDQSYIDLEKIVLKPYIEEGLGNVDFYNHQDPTARSNDYPDPMQLKTDPEAIVDLVKSVVNSPESITLDFPLDEHNFNVLWNNPEAQKNTLDHIFSTIPGVDMQTIRLISLERNEGTNTGKLIAKATLKSELYSENNTDIRPM